MRFVKFVVVGVSNTAVAFAVFNLFAVGLHLPAVWANALAWLAGFGNSYVWNRLWTFRDRRYLRTRLVLPRFAVANLVALAVSTAVVVALQRLLPGSASSATELNLIEGAAIGVSLVVNYTIASRWAFASREERQSEARGGSSDGGPAGGSPDEARRAPRGSPPT